MFFRIHHSYITQGMVKKLVIMWILSNSFLGFTHIAVVFGEGFKCFYCIRLTFATSMENIEEG